MTTAPTAPAEPQQRLHTIGAVCRRLNIEFPADKIAQALKDREK